MGSSESEAMTSEIQPMLERLITSRNRDLSMFLPFLLGFDSDPTRDHSGHNSGNNPTPDDVDDDDQHQQRDRDRIVLINPVTQGMVVIEGTGFDSLFRGVQKEGQPPAAKSAIEAMPSVEITTEEMKKECVICLEECGVGEVVKEMPCQHRFHGDCIEKWLNLHGSCPVCRFTMPSDATVAKKVDDDDDNGDGDGGESRGRREVWVSFSIGRRRSNDNGNGDGSTEEAGGNGRELDSGESE